jgi:hypothetical protein
VRQAVRDSDRSLMLCLWAQAGWFRGPGPGQGAVAAVGPSRLVQGAGGLVKGQWQLWAQAG